MTTPFPFVSGAVLTAAQMNDITNLPLNDQTASYTLVVGDAGKRVVMNVATDNTVTVDDDIFSVGDTIFVANKGAGASTLTAGAGVTINSASGLVLVQNQSGQLVALSASSFLFVLSAGPVAAPAVAIFEERQASGTGGGTFTSGTYTKRVLNTTVVNQITGCTLTSSVISLPAGTYQVTAFAPAFAVSRHKARLQNTTDSATIIIGQDSQCSGPADAQTSAIVQTVFTLAATKNVELQHRSSVTQASVGFGISTSFGDDEVYSNIMIVKLS